MSSQMKSRISEQTNVSRLRLTCSLANSPLLLVLLLVHKAARTVRIKSDILPGC